jgi:hypothetical protein
MTDWVRRALERKAGVIPAAIPRPGLVGPPSSPFRMVPPPPPPLVPAPPPPTLPPGGIDPATRAGGSNAPAIDGRIPSTVPIPPPPPPPVGEVRAPASYWLAQAAATSKGSLGTADEELARILSLPFLPEGTPRCPDRDGYGRSLLNHACPKGWKLRDIQVDAIYTYEQYGGLVAPCGTGWGKTIMTIMCGAVGIRKRGHRRVALCVPPEVYSQLSLRDLPQARSHLRLDGINFWFVQGTRQQRRDAASQPGPGVFIYAYSSLSTQTGYEELMLIAPTLFILDEAQCVANEKSARTKRLFSVAAEADKALRDGKLGRDVTCKRVEVCALSGTITKKSIKDYAYVARRCLHDMSPVPIKETAIQAFSRAIDAEVEGTGQTELDRERMARLIEWSRLHGKDPYANAAVRLTEQEATREAFRFRLNTSPGVVATSDTSADCSLIIAWSEPPRPVTAGSERMADLMTKVVKDMVTPDGDVIEFGMHCYKWLWELTAGFYNSLNWPSVEELQRLWVSRGKPITVHEAAALDAAAKGQHELLQEYHKELRSFLDYHHVPGCDSPMLVAQEIVRQLDGQQAKHRLPAKLLDTYRVQKAAWYEDLTERRARPIRLSDYKVQAAVDWARHHHEKGLGGIIWWHHPEIGRWIQEELVAAGIPHTYAPAGANEAPFQSGIVVASYAHGTGKNLQHQSRNLVVELRREAATMEQMISRTHRSGQMADDVRVDVLVSNGFDLTLFNAILRDSDYIQATTGMRQRLCYATYAPIIPPTNPRLAVRLGIVDEWLESPNVTAGQAITPVEALDLGSVFRSTMYAVDPVAHPHRTAS